mmetsp:Transcript_9398/g.29219  ORF Transcript_9398/g.29219 Transcript_9398/m.29219 type:complete len:364 (-) Transcript_9398:42-1133(-)
MASLRGASEVRWGIIGCGDVCEKKSGPALMRAPRSRVVAVMRRDLAKAEDFARRHGIGRAYDAVDALLADADVDAVYLATPPGSHVEIALQVAAAGKALYVEKPAARTATECETMAAAFEAASLPLFVAYYRRGYPRYAALRRSIREGRLGTVERVEYACAKPPGATGWRVDPEASGGGLFVDVGSHALDLVDFLLGPIADVRANVTGPSGSVETKVDMSFSAGALGKVAGKASWNFEAEVAEDVLTITGSDGSVRCPNAMNGRDVLWSRGGRETFAASHPPPDPVQLPLVTSVVDALLDGSECASTAASSTRCSRVMDAALDAYYGGRGDAFWARPETWGRRPSPPAGERPEWLKTAAFSSV